MTPERFAQLHRQLADVDPRGLIAGHPLITLLLAWRRCGAKHSEIDWKQMREMFDLMNETVQ